MKNLDYLDHIDYGKEDKIKLALYAVLENYQGEDKQSVFETYYHNVKCFELTLDEACKKIEQLVKFYAKK